MKKFIALIALALCSLSSQIALAADDVFPNDPAGRWEFFKTNYHAMPTGLKVCIVLIVVIIIASVVYYKLTAPEDAPVDEVAEAEETSDDTAITNDTEITEGDVEDGE